MDGDLMTLTSGIELPVDRIADICRGYGVEELAVFGSAIRLDMEAGSDIDTLVDFEPSARIGFVGFAALAEELEALLGRKIDLVTKLGLKPWVRPNILKE